MNPGLPKSPTMNKSLEFLEFGSIKSMQDRKVFKVRRNLSSKGVHFPAVLHS